MNPVPQLPAPGEPTKPHPIDVALAALGQFATELLASGKPSRFAEMQMVASIAQHIQRLRPAAGVDDVDLNDAAFDGYDALGVMMPNPVRRRQGGIRMAPAFNDTADLNTQILMMAQSFLEKYADIEKLKAKPGPSRMTEVMELSELMGLRSRLREEKEDVPDELNVRIDHLVKRIGEPVHEPASDPLVSSDDVRRHPPDFAEQPDRGRVGEPLAQRAGGDDGAR